MWIQLYVRAPQENGYQTPQAMKRIDEHLTQSFVAMFCCPEGLPLQESDGTWEVRVLVEAQAPLVKMLLTSHYGLEIAREVKND